MHSSKPYFHDLIKVKAILLGADPSNETDRGKADGIVKPGENRLGRTLIPFYRHYRYAIGKYEYSQYRKKVKRRFMDD